MEIIALFSLSLGKISFRPCIHLGKSFKNIAISDKPLKLILKTPECWGYVLIGFESEGNFTNDLERIIFLQHILMFTILSSALMLFISLCCIVYLFCLIITALKKSPLNDPNSDKLYGSCHHAWRHSGRVDFQPWFSLLVFLKILILA